MAESLKTSIQTKYTLKPKNFLKAKTAYKTVTIILKYDDINVSIVGSILSISNLQRTLLLQTDIIYKLNLVVINLTNTSLNLGVTNRDESVSVTVLNYYGEKYGLAMIKTMHHICDNFQTDLLLNLSSDFKEYLPIITKLLFHTTYYKEFTLGNFNQNKFINYYNQFLTNFILDRGVCENIVAEVFCIRMSLLRQINLEYISNLDNGFHLEFNKLVFDKCQNIFNVNINLEFKKNLKNYFFIAKSLCQNTILAFIVKYPFLSQLKLISILVLIIGYSLFLLSLGMTKSLEWSIVYNIFIVSFSVAMIAQGLFNLYCSLYSWENPENARGHKSPEIYTAPKLSFTVLLPALNEALVIGDTIRAVCAIDYPQHLKKVIVINKTSDHDTITAVNETIKELARKGISNIELLTVDNPKNKPDKLNYALKYVKTDVVCIFDAEDRPHSDLFHIVNTEMVVGKADVVQSGIQLMNYDSNWFSMLNVLEYYLWFKSALHLFAGMNTITLGGNTVFFKTKWIERLGGWNANCLAEDAEIGMRLSMAGAKIKVIYDPRHATQEETPPTLGDFIKQRTRWNQGFMQVLMNGEWLKLRRLKQKLLSVYLLAWPIMQAILFLYIPFSVLSLFFIKTNVWVTIISIIPLYILLFMVAVSVIAFGEFCKDYKIKFKWQYIFKIVWTFIPYQFLLGVGAYRAMIRILKKSNSWEKTAHINAHHRPQLVK